MEQKPAQTGVAVVGGGMASLTAACYLARYGANVVLFERAPYLGGRAATRNIHTMPYGSRISMSPPNARRLYCRGS
jgi:phytoene dehydrogenase-like protein